MAFHYNDTISVPVYALYGSLFVVAAIFAVLAAVYRRNRRYYEQFDLDLPPHGYDELADKSKHVNWADAHLQGITVDPQPVHPNTSFRNKLKESLPWKSATQHVINSLKPEAVEEYRGRMNFALSYNQEHETLYINLIQAIDLPIRDFTGSSDPYVRVFFAEEPSKCQRTKIHNRNLNPKFQQILSMTGLKRNALNDMTLVMQVLDYDRFSSDDIMGEVMLPMKNVKFDKNPVYWKHLQRPTVSVEKAGEIMITLCYLPESNKLNVTLLKAKDLPSREKVGSNDPYVKLWLVHRGTKLEKKKTQIKHQNSAPQFMEMFTFSVPAKEKLESEINLVVSVMNFDPISTNHEIGHTVLGLLGADTGVAQWREALANPEKSVTSWHKLAPRW
ncbi:Snt-6 [Aphelenchoides besseyi]|nr:Snt-6 [Aphelenchoides besseyi]KAI6194595.1 Snt-6 [Aphelenchoides besseyi]